MHLPDSYNHDKGLPRSVILFKIPRRGEPVPLASFDPEDSELELKIAAKKLAELQVCEKAGAEPCIFEIYNPVNNEDFRNDKPTRQELFKERVS